jgi:hypothetical protein
MLNIKNIIKNYLKLIFKIPNIIENEGAIKANDPLIIRLILSR